MEESAYADEVEGASAVHDADDTETGRARPLGVGYAPRVTRLTASRFVVISCWVVWLASANVAGRQRVYGIATLTLTEQAADASVALGTPVVRLVYGWDVIEGRCKGCFDWTVPDGWRDQARRTNRAIYGLLAYAPRWANGGQHYSHPPLRMQDWYDYVFATVKRYEQDIFYWAIWNEPNLTKFLSDGDVATYGMLASTARAAIRAANPAALILGPEVSWQGVRNGWFAAAMHDYGDLFDIITVHWYLDGPQLEYFMDHLVRRFALGKPVWLSETGRSPCAVYGEVGQAWHYRQILEALEPRRDWWTGVVFYVLHEPTAITPCSDAITRDDWSRRPAFAIYREFIRSNP
jgi:hypothetical protein